MKTTAPPNNDGVKIELSQITRAALEEAKSKTKRLQLIMYINTSAI